MWINEIARRIGGSSEQDIRKMNRCGLVITMLRCHDSFSTQRMDMKKNLKCHKVDRLSNYDVILGFSSLCRLHLRYDDFIATSDYNVLILHYASYFTTFY